MTTRWTEEQLKGFYDAAQSLKLYRRAELQNDLDGKSLIEELYVDPLPHDHILQTMLKANTTFLIGRKGTGKSTIFYRAQHELRKRSNYTSAYIDIKTIFESSRTDPNLMTKLDSTSGTLPKESLEKLRLYKAFLRALIQEISKEVKERVQSNNFWERVKRIFTGTIDDLFEDLDTILTDIDTSEYSSIMGIKNLSIHNKLDSSEGTDIEGSSNVSLWPATGLSASLKATDSVKTSSEHEQTYADILMLDFNIKGFILRLKDLLNRIKVKHLYIFIDDFSELPQEAMEIVVDSLLAPLNNWSEELIKFKVASYPGMIYYGKIDKTKIDEINLDLYRLYGISDVGTMEDKAIEFTRRLVERRLLHFCKSEANTFLDLRNEDIWRIFFYATMSNPRNIGHILFYLYESQIIYGQAINPSAIGDAARRYFEDKIEHYFKIQRFLQESFTERSSVLSLKELLDAIIKRARELREYKGSQVMREIPGRIIPTSHFHVVSAFETLLSTLELNFFLTKYYEMSDRDGRKVSIFALNYGLCQKLSITFGRPYGKSVYRHYYVERVFDYTPILENYLKVNQEITCNNCHTNFVTTQVHFSFLSGCAILISSPSRSNLCRAYSRLSREVVRMPLEGLHLGHYRLLRLLGSGGMGEVYLAEDARIGQQVAIKVIRAEGIAYPQSESAKEAARLFEREAKAIARLDHPNILPLYAYGEETLHDTLLTYLVMPYRKEGTLASWLRQRGRAAPLSPAEVVPLLQQAAEALQHAHDQHVLHQDIKPTNFLIRVRSNQPERPDLLLSDFGIAKLTSATASASQSIRGTPTYMAPEQWDGHPVPATDQYALAVMVYELLVGHPPFQGGPGQVMRQHYFVPPPAPSSLGEHLSPAIDAVLLRALSKDPEERFPSVSAFARAFHEAVQSDGELHATLAISRAEAESGTSRSLTLPGGRQVSVTLPAGVGDGTTLRLEGQGIPYYVGGPAGPLVLTIAIPAQASPLPLPQDSIEPTVAVSRPNAELPSVEDASVPPARPEAPGDLEPTVPASNESESAPTALATNATSLPTELVPHAGQPVQSAEATVLPHETVRRIGEDRSWGLPLPMRTPSSSPSQPQGVSKGRILLIVGLALLVIAGSIGIFSLVNANQLARSNMNVTATAQAHIRATLTAQAQSTATMHANVTTVAAEKNPYPPYMGTLVPGDPLSGTGSDFLIPQQQECQRGQNGVYMVSSGQGGEFLCSAHDDYSNLVFQVEMSITQGGDSGIGVRYNTWGYFFYINPNGSFTTSNLKGGMGIPGTGTSSAIKTGLNQINLIAIVANGSEIDYYVNRHLVSVEKDSTVSHGALVLVSTGKATFRNAKVWTL